MDLIVSVVLNLVWIAFWFYVGTKIVAKLKNIKQKENIITTEDILSQQLKKILILKTEVHDGVIFAFSVNDDQFIAQGTTIQEIASAAYKFRKIDLAFLSHESKEYWLVNGQISKVNIKLI